MISDFADPNGQAPGGGGGVIAENASMSSHEAFMESAQELAACPWDDLTPEGQGLQVHDFITTLFSHAANALRRRITVPYADQHGLSVSDWRVLSVLGFAGSLPFTALVEQAAADKGQVSRTLKRLEQRGWVWMESVGSDRRRGVVCRLTPSGRSLYDTVMPEARRSQAEMILSLPPQERRQLYQILKRLHGVRAQQEQHPQSTAARPRP